MFCISIRQPWSECIVRGVKPIEVRTWLPPSKLIGERVAIHAGKVLAKDVPDNVWEAVGKWGMHELSNIPDPKQWEPEAEVAPVGMVPRLGGIIGTAKLAKAFRFSYAEFKELQEKHLNPLSWYGDGLCGWEFSEPVRFERIIPCNGQLRFWELDETIEGRVKAALL